MGARVLSDGIGDAGGGDDSARSSGRGKGVRQGLSSEFSRTTFAEIAVAKTGDQPHPVFCLCRKRVLPGLGDYLAKGGRKIDAWYARLNVVEVLFDDQPDAFSNINTEEELRSHESR